MLARSRIEERLEEGWIFRAGTWNAGCIRAAGYDLRVSSRYLIAPSGKRYWPDGPDGQEERMERIVLKPGEVAFVSSVERVCMPLDLAGNIAQKFELARRGLLVMGGLLVDPGYGLELREDGTWAPDHGERLHFQLANIGAEQLTILPERDKIAGMQFLNLDGDAIGRDQEEKDLYVPSSADLLETMFDRGDEEPVAPLAFFPRTRHLEVEVEGLKQESDELGIKLESTRRSTDQLVVFGMFLLAITLFTVATAALIEALAGGEVIEAAQAVESADSGGQLSHDGLVVALILVCVVAIFCLAAIGNAIFLLRGRKRRTEKKNSDA